MRNAVFVNLSSFAMLFDPVDSFVYIYPDFHQMTCQSKIHYLLLTIPFHILDVWCTQGLLYKRNDIFIHIKRIYSEELTGSVLRIKTVALCVFANWQKLNLFTNNILIALFRIEYHTLQHNSTNRVTFLKLLLVDSGK